MDPTTDNSVRRLLRRAAIGLAAAAIVASRRHAAAAARQRRGALHRQLQAAGEKGDLALPAPGQPAARQRCPCSTSTASMRRRASSHRHALAPPLSRFATSAPGGGRTGARTAGASRGACAGAARLAGRALVDIRALDVPAPSCAQRMCARKGFDAVEPDNVDGYTNEHRLPADAHQLRSTAGSAARARARPRGRAQERPRPGRARSRRRSTSRSSSSASSTTSARCKTVHRPGKAVFEVEYEYSTPRSQILRPRARPRHQRAARKARAVGTGRSLQATAVGRF